MPQPAPKPIKRRRTPTLREKRYLELRKTAKTKAEAALKAGYAHPKEASRIEKKIREYGEVGLDTLKDVALYGTNELARANAGKTLTETAYGRPKNNDDNKQSIGNITINVQRLEDVPQLVKASNLNGEAHPNN